MIFPVGKSGNILDPLWYDSQGFGAVTNYGYHEAMDLNLRTGGDSDIGQPLYAVSKGKIVYYHNNSHQTTGFGRHMVLECDTVRGKRWYHYAHCLEITTELKDVNEGDVIGKLGKSGTTLAHLHFSVFKVDPAILPQGIDTIAKTLTQLNDWWEKFEIIEGLDMSKLLTYLNRTTDDEAITVIHEHLGTSNEKCDWGNANNQDNKSHLAEERRKSARFEADLVVMIAKIVELNKRIVELDALNSELSTKLVECENSSSTPIVNIQEETTIAGKIGVLNGWTIDSNGVVVANYMIKK